LTTDILRQLSFDNYLSSSVIDIPRNRMPCAGSTNETSVSKDLISRMPPTIWLTVTSSTLTSPCSLARDLIRSRHSGSCAEIFSCRIMMDLQKMCGDGDAVPQRL